MFARRFCDLLSALLRLFWADIWADTYPAGAKPWVVRAGVP